MVHPGEHPDFIMRVVSHPRSALERQLGEAVRIRRRGGEGSILNSRAEFNRCHVPRLRVEKKEEWEERLRETRQWEESNNLKLDEKQKEWEQRKARMRKQERIELGREPAIQRKRAPSSIDGRRGKRRKFTLVENWGNTPPISLGREAGGGGLPHPSPITTGAGEEEGRKMVRCMFNKGGVCQQHFVKGEKIKSKKWGLLKNKTFGWITTSKYRCRELESYPVSETSFKTVQPDASIHTLTPEVGEISSRGLENFDSTPIQSEGIRKLDEQGMN